MPSETIIKKNTDLIARSFNKARHSYSDHSLMQSHVCKLLVTELAAYLNHIDAAVDYGCGTGLSTQALLAEINIEQCYAVDIADHLLEEARDKLPSEVVYLNQDFDHPLFNNPEMDLAFANMSLQWSHHLTHTLAVIAHQLVMGGCIAFTVPVEDTFRHLKPCYRNEFTTLPILEQELTTMGFKLLHAQIESLNYPFDSPIAALKSIKAVGANRLLSGNKIQNGLSGAKKLKSYFNNDCYDLNYEVAIVIAQKVEAY